MEYSKITPLLVEAIKQLKAENDRLKSENEKVNTRLEKLETLLNAIVKN
jgi:cell division protein FtsB